MNRLRAVGSLGRSLMALTPVFLSLVYVVRNQGNQVRALLKQATEKLPNWVSDYELIVVDNASADDTLSHLRELTGPRGLPNLQVYALTAEVNRDTAVWVGMENALGDFVAVIDPLRDDLDFLPEMLDHAARGSDVVFASNRLRPLQGWAYQCARAAFNYVYKSFNGVDLSREAPHYRVLSKRILNYIMQHPQPAIAYRYLPAQGGFTRTNLEYSAQPTQDTAPSVRRQDAFTQAIDLLVFSTQTPMRVVTTLSMFGAAANLVYSFYVMGVGLLKPDVAPGWVSLSLQQSGMFFLLSLVLLVMGEYILQAVKLASDGPLYHVAQEFTSARITRREKLNIETVSAPTTLPAEHAQLADV